MGKTKEDIAYQYVRRLIAAEDLRPGDFLPTEASISEELGISRMAVAKALTSLKNEGFVERCAGRGTTLLRKPASSSAKLALLVSPWPTWDISEEWYFPRLLYAVQTKAIHREIVTVNLAIHAEQVDEGDLDKIRDIYQSVDCGGAIVIDPFLATHDRLQSFLSELGCSTVWAGSSQQEKAESYCVDIDDFQASFDLTEKMIQTGAKEIVYIGFPPNTTARQRRLEGYKAALASHQLEVSDRLVISNSVPAGRKEEAGRECAGIYVARNLDADAVIVSDLHVLIGVHEFCDQLNLPSLQKLKTLPVALFDYDRLGNYPNVRFSVYQPVEEIGEQLIQALLDIMEGREVPKLQVLEHEILSFSPDRSMGAE